MRTYDPGAGEHISMTCEQMVMLANATKDTVTASFNDIQLTANPGDTAEQVAAIYSEAMRVRAEEHDRKRAAFLKTPEGQEELRRQAEAKAREEAAIREGIIAFDLADAEAWVKCRNVNEDGGYGEAVLRYASRWARMMDAEIATGAAVADIAKRCSHEADVEGITGFMYGCAVGILATVWRHGEELRRWHNIDTQIGTEGERANKRGGVLNPAVLSIA